VLLLYNWHCLQWLGFEVHPAASLITRQDLPSLTLNEALVSREIARRASQIQGRSGNWPRHQNFSRALIKSFTGSAIPHPAKLPTNVHSKLTRSSIGRPEEKTET
jgi:hypothetical protein